MVLNNFLSYKQEFQLLSCLLSPVCRVPKTVLQIKHCIIQLELSYHIQKN